MLPAIFVTFATFFLELGNPSPVYNMQPAFITANIGTGRNIRNLPCISRKNSQSGVCMFAIDCLKANGTHLGTCIDRFYFGSCCHIQPVHDIVENSIDSDIIPAREPPMRITTISPSSTPTQSTTVMTAQNRTTLRPINLNKTVDVKPTTVKSTPNYITTSPLVVLDRTSTTSTTTASPVTGISTEGQKFQTFQSVEGVTTVETTTKRIVTTVRVPPRPITSVKPAEIKPTRPSTSKPIKPSVKPTKPTSKPTKVTSTTKRTPSTTRKPSTARPVPLKTTKIPSTTTTTRRTTTTRATTTSRPATTSKLTKKPTIVTKPTKKIITASTTSKPTTRPSLTTAKFNITTTKIPSTVQTSTLPSTTVPNDLIKLNITTILGSVNGNTATNEIDIAKPALTTQKPTSNPSLVTWTVADIRNTSATTTVANVTEAAEATTEDWVPITTPDGWVLLPSVAPNGTNASSTVETTSTVPSTVPTTSSKPSTNYIPLLVTTGVPTTTVSTTTQAAVENATSTTVSTSAEPATTPALDMNPVNMSDFTDVCGRRMYPEARIVGGEKSTFGKWPWQISLRQWRTSTYLHKCGAALLNENWAITAAHCVDNVPPSDLLLRLGEHDLSTEAEPYLHQERRVQIVASHPQFDPRTFEYDLALLRFYEPVTFQPNILPVCVPQSDENFVGRTAYVTGWGRLYEDGPLPSVLQEVSVPVINNSVCESMYRSAGYIEHIPHIFICAGWRRGGFDSCEGDSGGPMVIQREDKRFLLAGIISWGIGCAEPNQPGVYTRISEFRDWINQILQF